MSKTATTSTAAPMGRTTVVIMSHNYGRYLGQAISSVLGQTRRAAKLVVVDDASDDGTDRVVRPYLDQLEYYRVEFRSEQRTRNFGLSHATSEYVLFLDADDYMADDMLECLESALNAHPEARLAYCDKFVFGNDKAMERLNLAPQWRAGDFSLPALRFKNFVMATSLVRRRCIEAFDERIVNHTDWDTWLGIIQDESHAIYVPLPLLHYRVHGENASIRQRDLIERLKILVKHDLIRADRPLPEPCTEIVAPRVRQVVVLAVGAKLAEPAPWQDLARRRGWKIRAIVGMPRTADSAKENAEGIVRTGDVLLQTSVVADIEELFRRYAGAIADPLVDAVIVTSDPGDIPAGAAHFGDSSDAMRCDRSVAAIVSSRTLDDLGTFSLSPAAVRTLLYLPPPRRLTAVGRLQRAAADLVSKHFSWRFRRAATTSRRQES